MLPSIPLRKQIREKLIKDAVKDLQRWRFPYVDNNNIITDLTYSYYFGRMLEKRRGLNKDIDIVINELVYEITFASKNI